LGSLVLLQFWFLCSFGELGAGYSLSGLSLTVSVPLSGERDPTICMASTVTHISGAVIKVGLGSSWFGEGLGLCSLAFYVRGYSPTSLQEWIRYFEDLAPLMQR